MNAIIQASLEAHGNFFFVVVQSPILRRISQFPSSQMVSRLRSPRRSAPQTDHRFLLSRPNAAPSVLPRELDKSRVPFVLLSSPPSAASAAAFNCAILSASKAASSASGESGMVSKLEMLGLRDRAEVGVDGTEEDEKEPG